MKVSNQKVVSKGFTLIELMIAIAIVAILVAMAVPAYKDYSVRAKIAECINNSAVAKVQISEYKQTLGAWPPSLDDAGLGGAAGISLFCDGYIRTLSTPAGAFVINVNEAAVDLSISGDIAPQLKPTPTPSNIINWTCSVGLTSPGNVKYLPATCRGS